MDTRTPEQIIKAAARNGITLVYLDKSQELMGMPLFNVMAPQLPDYPKNGTNNGVPTFSLDTLKEKGLVSWF